MQEGKIIKALSGFYYVYSNGEVYQCRGRGVFRKDKVTPLVGDNVQFQADNQTEGYILQVKPRKNELKRPPIANVDQAIVVFSAMEPNFSPTLLDRFLVYMESKGIVPFICITKMDKVEGKDKNEIEQFVRDYEHIGYSVLLTSAKTMTGIEKLVGRMDGKISVFAGQSGVGKSSLLNAINPDLMLKTAHISTHLGRGKHTTRHVELIKIGNGLVADTPGFSSIEFTTIEKDELTDCFPEFRQISEKCKFRGCLHINEPHCAVKQAVETSEIQPYRYQNYKKFLQEINERKPRY